MTAITKEDLEKWKRETKGELLAELQDRGISGADYRRIRRQLQLEEVKNAGASDWFRSNTKYAHHHWKTLMWTLLHIHKMEGTIDNAWKFVNQKPFPWVRVAVVIGLFSMFALVLLNPGEAIGLGGWLSKGENELFLAVIAVVALAFYFLLQNRSRRKEQEGAP